MNHFTVPGHPIGYYAQGKRPNWARMKRYHAYKQTVQLHAQAAGIDLPLSASKEAPLVIEVVPYFKNGVHSDPGNVQKGICDALFYGAKGAGDKYTGGSFTPPMYDKEHPRAEVWISAPKSGDTWLWEIGPTGDGGDK